MPSILVLFWIQEYRYFKIDFISYSFLSLTWFIVIRFVNLMQGRLSPWNWWVKFSSVCYWTIITKSNVSSSIRYKMNALMLLCCSNLYEWITVISIQPSCWELQYVISICSRLSNTSKNKIDIMNEQIKILKNIGVSWIWRIW